MRVDGRPGGAHPAGDLRPTVEASQAAAATTGVLFLLAGALVMACSGALAGGRDLVGLRTLAGTALVVGLGTLALRSRLPPLVAHLLVLSGSALISLALSLTSGAAGAVALAGLYALAAIVAAFFFPWPAAALHLCGCVASCLLTLSPRSGLGPAVLVAGTSVAVAGVVGWLVHAAAAAELDHLTTLPNRRALDRLLREAVVRARRAGAPLSVALLDLDGFKRVNDTLGHAEGDRLLRGAAACWSALLSGEQVLARQGGDEFVLVLPGLTAPEAVALVDRLRLALPGGRTCSAGVAQWQPEAPARLAGTDEPSGPLLLARADTALYQAKRAGRDCTRAHTGAGSVGGELRAGLARGELVVHHRPVVRLHADGRAGEVVGSLATLRWQHPQRGLLAVADLPAVASSAIAVELGRHLLVRACTDATRERAGGTHRTVAVELSAAHLREPTCAAHLRYVLERTRLPGEALLVEVTEAALEAAGPAALAVLRTVRALGVRVALVGFGSGCASLGRLGGLPVDVVAVAPQVVADVVGPDPLVPPVGRAVVAAALALGLEVRADGVDQASAGPLAALGCTSASGALAGPALPALRPVPSGPVLVPQA